MTAFPQRNNPTFLAVLRSLAVLSSIATHIRARRRLPATLCLAPSPSDLQGSCQCTWTKVTLSHLSQGRIIDFQHLVTGTSPLQDDARRKGQSGGTVGYRIPWLPNIIISSTSPTCCKHTPAGDSHSVLGEDWFELLGVNPDRMHD